VPARGETSPRPNWGKVYSNNRRLYFGPSQPADAFPKSNWTGLCIHQTKWFFECSRGSVQPMKRIGPPPALPAPIPVAILVRVSTAKQETDRQIFELREVAEKNGWQVSR